MDFDDLRREGSTPAISPNAGARRILCWTRRDIGAFGEALRKAFPDALFYEDFRPAKWIPEPPRPRILDRLDDPTIKRNIEIVFPFRGWKPEMASIARGPHPDDRFWTWSQYLSPVVTIWLNARDACVMQDWNGRAMDAPVEYWQESSITTSYRRELPEERRIAEKAVRIAERICVRAVPVGWLSYDDFRSKAERVSEVGLRYGFGWVTPAVLDWYRAAPNRAIRLKVGKNNYGTGCLPVEYVPDSAWGDVPKPKWAQR